jgi:hypothetical protein
VCSDAHCALAVLTPNLKQKVFGLYVKNLMGGGVCRNGVHISYHFGHQDIITPHSERHSGITLKILAAAIIQYSSVLLLIADRQYLPNKERF